MKSSLRVASLTAEFILGEGGELWFSHATGVRVALTDSAPDAAAAPTVVDYAVRCVLATHPKGPDSDGAFATPQVNQFVRVGASPRAAQAITLGAKVLALMDGRASISIDDVRKVATPALRHRIIMNFEAEAEGVRPDSVIRNILETLPRDAAG